MYQTDALLAAAGRREFGPQPRASLRCSLNPPYTVHSCITRHASLSPSVVCPPLSPLRGARCRRGPRPLRTCELCAEARFGKRRERRGTLGLGSAPCRSGYRLRRGSSRGKFGASGTVRTVRRRFFSDAWQRERQVCGTGRRHAAGSRTSRAGRGQRHHARHAVMRGRRRLPPPHARRGSSVAPLSGSTRGEPGRKTTERDSPALIAIAGTVCIASECAPVLQGFPLLTPCRF